MGGACCVDVRDSHVSDKYAKGRPLMGVISDAASELAGKVEVDFVDWYELRKDQVRSRVIVGDVLLGNLLDILIKYCPSARNKVKRKSPGKHRASDRAGYAHVLGLITNETMEDLRTMHRIRNIFAHEWKADSSNGRLIELIRALSTAKGKEKRVTASHLMDFYFEAGRRCRDSILKAIDGLETTGDATARQEG